MNLLFVIDNLGSGGAQRQMVNLAKGMQSRGHYVELFTYYPENHYQAMMDEVAIPVFMQPKRSRFSISPLLALRSQMRQRHFDVVLSFLNTPNFYAEISCIGTHKSKLVVSERFMYPPGKLPVKLRILQEFHRFADAITVNSHHQRNRMEKEFPWMAKKLHTIYNGFDLDTFQPAATKFSPAGTLSLLAIASVAYKKNSLNLARAVALCKARYGIEVKVDWVGKHYVSGERTRPKEETDRFLKEHGISNLWRWLGERTDIPELLATHDALVHPSFFEGLPNVVCEALACGRPVLVSRVCDHPLLVQDGISGYLFDPNSPDDIARAIHMFSGIDLVQRRKMEESARDYAERHLSLNRYLTEYEDLFYTMLA